jgi:hypothetical protein
VDALATKYPKLSSYSYSANNPIFLLDPDGKQIEPVGDQRGNASAATSMEMLSTYFHTVFGHEMTEALMSSVRSGVLGNFESHEERAQWATRFEAELNLISDEHVKSLAIGVFEAISSEQRISFIGYAGNAGNNNNRCYELTVGKNSGNESTTENYFSNEPMILGTPSLCQLQNTVDVCYDPKGTSTTGVSPSNALVAVSDGVLTNQGSLESPLLSVAGVQSQFRMHQSLSFGVVAHVSAASQILRNGMYMEPTQVIDQDGKMANRYNSDGQSKQNFFIGIANTALQNLRQPEQLRNNKMDRSDKKSMGKMFSPKRKNFGQTEG